MKLPRHSKTIWLLRNTCRVPPAAGLRLGLLTLPPVGDEDFQTRASQPAPCDRNLHNLKITSRSGPPSAFQHFPRPSELYPFVFFTLRDHPNDSLTCSI